MSRERFVFDDLDLIDARIRRLTEDAAYLVLQDRTAKEADARVGRFDLIETSARPWLQETTSSINLQALVDQAAERGEDEAEDGEEDGDNDDETGEPTEVDEADLTWTQIKEAASRWIRDTAMRHTAGQPPRRFRLKVLGPKGSTLLDSGHFGCTDRQWRAPKLEEAPATEAVQVAPPSVNALPRPADVGAATPGDALGALAVYYTQFGQLVLGTFGQLQNINLGNVTRLSRDLDRSRDQVEELVASILEHRATESERAHTHAIEHQKTDATTVIARDFVHQVGEATRQWIGAQALPPQLAKLAPSLSKNPELLLALGDPNVLAMLEDPAATAQILPMLRLYATQLRGQATANGTSPAGANPDIPPEQSGSAPP